MNQHTDQIAKERINWIDWARTIGIWLVVIGHLHDPETENWAGTVIYGFHMPLFFILSGFFHRNGTTLYDNLHKHFKTLIIPFLLFQILFILFYGTISHFFHVGTPTNHIQTAINLFSHLGINLSNEGLFVNYIAQIIKFLTGIITQAPIPNGPTWFLLALFTVKIIMDLLLRIKYKEIVLIVILALLYLGNNTFAPLYINSSLMALPLYYLGYKIRPFISRIKIKTIYLFALSVLFLLISVGLTSINGRISMHTATWGSNLILFYINGCIGSVAIIAFALAISNKHYSIVTKISLATLLIIGIHNPICQMSIKVIEHTHIGLPTQFIISGFISAIILLLSVPLYDWTLKYAPFMIGKSYPVRSKKPS